MATREWSAIKAMRALLKEKLAPLANPLMLGKLRRYRGIEADRLAAAMVRLLENPQPGQYNHQYDAIRALAAES